MPVNRQSALWNWRQTTRVYKNNELIFSKEIDLKRSESSMNGEILEFLADINRVAVAAGVIPDPLTGKVGNMDAGTMVETGEKWLNTAVRCF